MKPAIIIGGAAAALGAGLVTALWWREPPAPPPAMDMSHRNTSLPMPAVPPPTPVEPTPGRLEARPVSVTLSTTAGQPAQTTVVIGNGGEKPVRVTAVRVAGDGSISAAGEGCMRELAGHDGCTVNLTFNPPGGGARTADLLVMGEGATPLVVPIAASAAQPPAALRDDLAELAALLREQRATAAPGERGGMPAGGVDVTEVELLRGEPATVTGRRRGGYDEEVGRVDASLPISLDRVLAAASYVTATLETSIDSQRCPAPVVLKVDRHVLAAHGQHIVLPAHSMVLGECLKMEKGKSRVGIALKRVRRPDGSNAMIKEVAGDQMGRSGLVGELDDRAWQRTAQVLLTSAAAGVMAGAAAMTGNGTSISTTGSAVTVTSDPLSAGAKAASNSVTDSLSGTIDKMVSDSLDTVPRVTVAKGTLVTMVITTDVWFPEEKESDKIAVPVIGEPVAARPRPGPSDVVGR
jgi:type IV secretion system protein VirB10